MGEEQFYEGFAADVQRAGYFIDEVRNIINALANPMDYKVDAIQDLLWQFFKISSAVITLGERTDIVEVQRKLAGGEGQHTEFKSTMRCNLKTGKRDPVIEKEIAKTIAGFMNSEGGTLLIGVEDDGTVRGLEADFATLQTENLDLFARVFIQLISNSIGRECMKFINARPLMIKGKIIFVVDVEPGLAPAYVVDGEKVEYYKRILNSTQPFNIRQAIEDYEWHWLQNKPKPAFIV